MMLKTVYGPPPADMERIEDVEPEGDNEIWEDEVAKTFQSVITAPEKLSLACGSQSKGHTQLRRRS